ncbi:MAG: 30S ribosomal protein S6 [candidate division Zixibacteria bacterium]|nr:30S ribosomal protein S6 [candidate division Zixibacteria bacterium]
MPIYDTTFVLNPQLEEAGMESRIKEVVDLIGSNGGKLVTENRIGMRRLAYEIKKLTQGYYVSMVYDGNGDLVNEIERRFRLDENCLRFLTCIYQEVTNVMEGRPSRDEHENKYRGRSYRDRSDRDRSDRDRPDRDRPDRGRSDRVKPVEAKKEEAKPAEEKPIETKPVEDAPAKEAPVVDKPAEAPKAKEGE